MSFEKTTKPPALKNGKRTTEDMLMNNADESKFVKFKANYPRFYVSLIR